MSKFNRVGAPSGLRSGNMDILILVITGAVVSIAVVVVAAYRRSHSIEGKYDVDGTAAAGATTVYKPIEITRNTPPQRKKHFYGVSVRPGINCCDAVKTIARERYLQGEAPALPLPDCDRENCKCIMQPENDRRTSIDRRADAFSAYGDFRDNWHPARRSERQERRKK